jgi:hypothetical protein
MKRLFIILAVCAVASFAFAQTVIVNDTVASSPPGQYDNLTDAINSFTFTGANGNNPAANVINIQSFGPYDEVLPVIGIGVFSGSDIPTTDPLTINGDNGADNPLILAQDTGLSGSSVIINGGTSVTLKNLVIAQSPTAIGNDDFFFILNDDTNVNFVDTVVTALPTTSTTFTAADLYVDYGYLVDGSAPYDASLVRSGDNGLFTGLSGGTDTCVIYFDHSIMTQQGDGASPDGFVNLAATTLYVKNGSKVNHNKRLGIQTGNDHTLIISDSEFVCNNEAGTAAISQFGGPVITATNTVFRNYESGIIPRTGVHTYTNCTFQDMNDHGILSVSPTSETYDNCTFLNCAGYGWRTIGATTASINNSSFDGCGGNATFPGLGLVTGGIEVGGSGATVDVSNSSFVNGLGVGIRSYSDGGILQSIDNCCFANNALGDIINLSDTAVAPLTITNSTLYGTGGASVIQLGASGDSSTQDVVITDSILASAGANGIEWTDKGDVDITVTNTALVLDGADALAAAWSPGFVTDPSVVYADPIFSSTNPIDADFLDVRNAFYGDKDSVAGPLKGCANYIGDIVPASGVPNWQLF